MNHDAEAHYATEAAVASLESAYNSGEVAAQRRETIRVLGLARGECVLDVGCGVGHLSAELAAEVGSAGLVCAMDASPAMIARARARQEEMNASPPVQFSVGSATKLPFEDASFDAIVCAQVLCYVVEPAAALREMARVLRADGRIVILDTDWRTRVLATSDEARAARILSAIHCAFGFADTHLPPKLPALARSADLTAEQVSGFVLARVGSFERGSYFDVAAWCTDLTRHGVPAEETSWFASDQEALSREGTFYYTCTRTLITLRHAARGAKRRRLPPGSERAGAAASDAAQLADAASSAAESSGSGGGAVASAVRGPMLRQAAAVPVAIRPATAADCGRIAKIWNWYIEETTFTFTTELKTAAGLEEVLTAKAAATQPFLCAHTGFRYRTIGPLSAVCDGDVVGFATYGAFRSGPGYQHSVEHSVYVSHTHCGRGVGAALLSALERHASEHGVRVMVGGLSSENAGALAFHARKGYAEVGRVTDAGRKFGRWLDLVLVQRVL